MCLWSAQLTELPSAETFWYFPPVLFPLVSVIKSWNFNNLSERVCSCAHAITKICFVFCLNTVSLPPSSTAEWFLRNASKTNNKKRSPKLRHMCSRKCWHLLLVKSGLIQLFLQMISIAVIDTDYSIFFKLRGLQLFFAPTITHSISFPCSLLPHWVHVVFASLSQRLTSSESAVRTVNRQKHRS